MDIKQKKQKRRNVFLSCGILEQILFKKEFFNKNQNDFKEVVKVVREAFGTEMTEQDIYEHLTIPQKVFLLRNGRGIFAMGSYTSKDIQGKSILYIEGVAIHPLMQGRRVFEEMTSQVLEDETYLSLRTQSPRMYSAFTKLCGSVYPNVAMNCPEELVPVFEGMADRFPLFYHR